MPRIERYRFGHVVVDGEEQTRDVVVLPDRVLASWWRADGHKLVLADLDDVIEELPERLVVGTGAYGRMRPEPKTLAELRQRGVEVEVLPTDEAVRRRCAGRTCPRGRGRWHSYVDDPDAPGGVFTHWIAWGLDPANEGLSEGEPAPYKGQNDFGATGYRGPCPPPGHGRHRYVFRLYALDADLEQAPVSRKPSWNRRSRAMC